jgi:hypothetical protein
MDEIAVFFSEKNHKSFYKEILNTLPVNSKVHLFGNIFFSDFSYSGLEMIWESSSMINLISKSYKYDKIIIDEIFNKRLVLLVFLIFKRSSVYLAVHNLNSWFHPLFFRSYRSFFFSFIYFFLSRLFENFIVVGQELKDWGNCFFPEKNFLFIPFGFSPAFKCKEKVISSKINVVIPGMVGKRKKYDKLHKLLKNRELCNAFHFTLLGKPEDAFGRSIINSFGVYDNITTYYSFIPEDEFHYVMCQSDLILSDLDIEYITKNGQKEFYGITKETGISFLMMQYGLPAVLPADFIGMQELSSQIMKYRNSEDLLKIFHRIRLNPSLIISFKNFAIFNKEELKEKIDFV